MNDLRKLEIEFWAAESKWADKGSGMTKEQMTGASMVFGWLASIETVFPAVTHGRHCPCSACAREDWTDRRLAYCGIHGASCLFVYAPIARSSSKVETDG